MNEPQKPRSATIAFRRDEELATKLAFITQVDEVMLSEALRQAVGPFVAERVSSTEFRTKATAHNNQQ